MNLLTQQGPQTEAGEHPVSSAVSFKTEMKGLKKISEASKYLIIVCSNPSAKLRSPYPKEYG